MSHVKSAFRDVRTHEQLLDGERPPKGLSYIKKNPISSKFSAIVSKVSGISSKVGNSVVGKFALRGASKIAAAVSGLQFLKTISGSSIKGNIGSVASNYGVQIIEETNPINLIRPLKDGPSISPAQAALSLSQTTAHGISKSLITNVPVAKGVATKNIFKSLAKIKSSPRFFDPRKATTSVATTANTTISLIQQRGMLQDEIMYRLVLLAENVYEPILKYAVENGYGRPIILEGFRSENSGTSQHERGEAIDLALPVNTSANLFNLAVWIRDNVMYDQLILCHSGVAGTHSWIHISFTPDTRRRQVLTKTFNDTFEDGLHIYTNYTDLAQLALDKATAKARNLIADDILQRLAARETKLNPIGVNTQEQVKTVVAGSNGASSSGPDGRSGAPVSKPVYVGHPGGTCSLASMPDNENWSVETPSYLEQLAEAQAELQLTRGSDPTIFNTDGTVVNEVTYCQALATVLQSYGFCAEATVRVPDEISVKTTNEFCDQYDVVSGSTNMPILIYAATLRPSRF